MSNGFLDFRRGALGRFRRVPGAPVAPREVAEAILCALGRLKGRLRRVPGGSWGSPGGRRSDPLCSEASPGDPWRALGGPTSPGDPLSSDLQASP